MTIRTRGLIIRETDVSDYDKMMTVLTPDYGKISVFGRGIKRYTSPYFHAAQLFCYSDFLLYAKKQYYILNECECVESFFSLRDEIGALSLATYLADIAGDICLEGENEADMLQLTLNALYCLLRKSKPEYIIKGAYEFRAAAIAGFLPQIGACAGCGCETGDPYMYLDVMNGLLYCERCYRAADFLSEAPGHEGTARIIRRLPPGVLAALRYIITTRAAKQFSFILKAEAAAPFSEVCETFLLSHLGHGFSTLSFYKEILRLAEPGDGKAETNTTK